VTHGIQLRGRDARTAGGAGGVHDHPHRRRGLPDLPHRRPDGLPRAAEAM